MKSQVNVLQIPGFPKGWNPLWSFFWESGEYEGSITESAMDG
jgi:hypothetical protein